MALSRSAQITLLEAEVTDITTAISHILKGGQSYTIQSASGAGTVRTVTMADYPTLVKEKNSLNTRIASLESRRSVKVRANW